MDSLMKKRWIALLLCCSILLSVCTGCNVSSLLWMARMLGETTEQSSVAFPEELPSSSAAPAETPSSSEAPSASAAEPAGEWKDYFPDDVWRADVDFSEVEYEHYELVWLEELSTQLVEAVAADPTIATFNEQDSEFLWELYYIYTMYVRIELDYMADPGAPGVQEEYTYAETVWYDAYEIYWETMSEVAREHPEIMAEAYADWQIEMFAEYEPGDGTDTELFLRESELVQEYYVLIDESYPDYSAICEVYVELVALRKEIAAYYGYDTYAEYAYDSVYYRDYTPEDVQAIWEVVKTDVSPVLWEHAYYGSDVYGLDYSPKAILLAMDSVLQDFSPEVYEAFCYMLEHGLYDIADTGTKVEIGYTTALPVLNQPFIFNSPYGEWYDYTTMFHEFGHFLSSYYAPGDLFFGAPDNDLCELQSQGMEVMFTQWYEEIVGSGNVPAAERALLVNLLGSIQQGAMYDEFQQRVYSEENLTADKVTEIFKDVYRDYGCPLYAGYEYEWATVLHNFEFPFYYISYGVSAVPALEIYAELQQDPAAAVDTYLTVAAMDPEMWYFAEAMEEAGLREVFDAATIAYVAEAAGKALTDARYGR